MRITLIRWAAVERQEETGWEGVVGADRGERGGVVVGKD